MKYLRKRQLADITKGNDSPLNSAVVSRDGSTIEMVAAAVKHNQVMLAYQPVMQAQSPHGTAFYEGLIRVLDATGRVIPARDFLHAVENTDLGRQLDCLALEHGLKTLIRNPSVRLSLNMSARSIGYRRWMRILDRYLNKDATLGERLMLEITEASAMTVPELVIDFMDRLQDRCIGFALDGFGSGDTTFRYFRDFFFDAVKIDGQFIRNVHADADNQTLTRALVAVAKEFDMLIVAQSVEEVADAEFLVSIGVDCLQGYLFGAPTIRPPWIPQAARESA